MISPGAVVTIFKDIVGGVHAAVVPVDTPLDDVIALVYFYHRSLVDMRDRQQAAPPANQPQVTPDSQAGGPLES